jgi:prevent-host-death family protein
MERVGVRELRQNLSVYLRRVAAGESLEVTERGHPVAVLGPLPAQGVLAGLVASGRLRPASGALADLPGPLPAGAVSGTAALADLRADER